MIDICRGLGERMLSLGHTNTFMKVASTYMYESLAHAEEAVRRSGVVLGQNGSPADLGPLVFTFTGDGKVSRGAQVRLKLGSCCCIPTCVLVTDTSVGWLLRLLWAVGNFFSAPA